MTGIADVQTAIADLGTALDSDFSAIQAALGNIVQPDDPRFQAVVDAVATAKANAAASTAAIVDALTPDAPPAG